MFLFLLGRDYKLSTLEILSYFKLNKIDYKLYVTSEKYLIFEKISNKNFKKIINDLGGTTRIYKIFHTSKELNSSFLNYFDNDYSNKFNYSISYLNITHNQLEFIVDSFKLKFKEEKIKAVYKKPKKQKDKKQNTIVNPNNYFSYSLDKGFETIVVKDKNIFYFGYALECTDIKDLIIKDTQRPEKEKLYSTSFRLIKIMINLLGLKKGKRILDPFCGLGNFLIEGLSKGYDVVGIDKDRDMVLKSKKNVSWAVSHFKLKTKYNVLHGDSTKAKFFADAVAFEPYMGPFISKLPNYNRARDIISSLDLLYFNLFKNLSKNLKSKTKVVCILPEIQTYDGQKVRTSESVFLKNGFVFFNFSKIDEKIDFENPIFYTTPNDSKINRYIYILEKK